MIKSGAETLRFFRNFTSSGDFASSVEKYHYTYDFIIVTGTTYFIQGVIAILQCRSHRLPDMAAKVIKDKILSE